MHRDLMAMSERARERDDRLASTVGAVHESLKKLVQLMEQNAVPGLTNRLLARFVRAAAVTFESTAAYFGSKAFVSGNPVRPEFLAEAAKVGLEINPKSGAELEWLAREVMGTSPQMVKRLEKLLE